MTKQELEKLINRLLEDSSNDIKLTRCNCDTVSGRMVCEWEAGDAESLRKWLSHKNIQFRGESEWLMKVQLEVQGKVLVNL